MGTIDTKAKEYMQRPEVFADLFNHLMYDGEQKLKPDDLTAMDPTEMGFPFGDDGKTSPVQKYRDVLKNAIMMEDDEAAYLVILGVENQTEIHYAMPVRNMLYDALNYGKQVTDVARNHKINQDKMTGAEFLSGFTKSDRLIPVVTLVVYFGQDEWDGPLSIHEMFSRCNEGILKYVPEYRINLIAPVSMSDKEIDKFKSDFRELATIIRCGKNRSAMETRVENDVRFEHLDPLTADLAFSITKTELPLKVNEKGEVNMCQAIKEIREAERQEGRMEEKKEIALNLHSMNMKDTDIANVVNVSLDVVRKWLENTPV